MTLALETQALTKRYGRRLALDAIDLAVEPGTVFGVIGPNGAGKTTTMRLLLDIIRPTSGSARVLGQDPQTGGAELRRRIGFLPGELRLEGRVTGKRAARSTTPRSAARSLPAWLINSHSDWTSTSAAKYASSRRGTSRSSALCRRSCTSPDLLVLDEPTSGLDPLVQQEFLSMVREAKANGQTVFLSSHVLSEIQQAADAVAILRAGKIVTVSNVDALRATALRRVNATIADATAEAVRAAFARDAHLTELTVTQGDTLTVAGTIQGDIDPFVKALATLTVVDLRVEEPDLEESVLGLYAKESTDD